MSNQELLEIISKPMAGTEEICLLTGYKKQKARCIRADIEKEILSEGKTLPPISKKIPMRRLIKHLGIDENRIIKLAKIELEMQSIIQNKEKQHDI